jgi:hypothetical protein
MTKVTPSSVARFSSGSAFIQEHEFPRDTLSQLVVERFVIDCLYERRLTAEAALTAAGLPHQSRNAAAKADGAAWRPENEEQIARRKQSGRNCREKRGAALITTRRYRDWRSETRPVVRRFCLDNAIARHL